MNRTPLRRTSNTEKRTLERQADRLWALLILMRARNRCERCGRSYCQAAHIVPRRFKHLRHHEKNGCALCPDCHFFADNYPEHFHEWLNVSAQDRYAILARRHETPGPVTAAMLTEKIEELKAALRTYL